jgi:hypothetical protein
MKRTRSLSMLLVSGLVVGALVSSCTIETKSGDGSGGSSSGTTGGTSSGTTGGSAATTGGSEANTGGSAATTGGSAATTGGSATTTGGSSAAGAGGSSAGAGGDDTQVGGNGGAANAGAGGEGGVSFDDCDTCLDTKCTAELDACLADTQCISDDLNGSGQYEQVVACVEGIRTTRPVKRIDLRDCGNSVGSNLNNLWPPDEMTVATVDLINCMATGVANEAGNSAWANQANVTNAWAPASCAKLACTSQLP